MESIDKNTNNVIKRKKQNFLQKFGNRISKYFNKSKSSKNIECNSSKSCLDDIPVTSLSHDNLNHNETCKRKGMKISESLNIPKRNDRCLSEGDLTQGEDPFYSQARSSKAGISKVYKSNANGSSGTENNFNGSFKDELAQKLKVKSQPKGNVSELSKTPDSPTCSGTGVSPPRQLFTEPRTPLSMSSLSHSSNSLLSATANNNFVTSDGESMSRSMVDSNDDMSIVVDLSTPISKISTGSLLDSTAARQKIAVARARRIRPKGLSHTNSEKSFQKDSKQFSPVRDKRDILEEISEEDGSLSSHSPRVSEQPAAKTPVDTEPTPTISLHKLTARRTKFLSTQQVEDVPVTSETLTIRPDSSITDLPLLHSSETLFPDKELRQPVSETQETKQKINIHKSFFQAENKTHESTPKYYVKLRPVTSSKESSTKNSVLDPSDSPATSKSDRPISDPSKINRYVSYKQSKMTKTAEINPPPTADCPSSGANNEANAATNLTSVFGEKRASRVLSMVKNFESVPCTDSN